MARYIFLIILNFLLPWSVSSQNIFLIEKPGTVKNYKFHEGDDIHIRIKNLTSVSDIEGPITQISDSSIIIDYSYFILTKDIISVCIERFWVKLAIPVLFIAGVGYLALEALNRTINKETPVITNETAIIGSSLVAGGAVLFPFKERRLNVGEKWRVKTLVFD